MLVLDEVIGVQGSYDSEKKVLVAREIISPDIEEQKGGLAPQRVYAAFLSDLHFGSEDFMAEAFSGFVDWLSGRSGDPQLREIGRLTRYVVICGDLIQGGKQLLERYTRLAAMLRGIPENVLILAIPGEQDVAGMLEPQSGFLDEALKAFSDLKNFRHASNPCWARLAGVPVLLYHGRSLEDWASSLGTEEPCELLREIMVRRHIAPIYGSAVPLAPVGRDPFLIGEVPRIFQVGHTHRKCSSSYKGVLLLSSPSWKASESERGSGTVYVVDLSSLESREINFGRGAQCS
jgi:DNA polymerase II small subunit